MELEEIQNQCKVNDLIENYPEMFKNIQSMCKLQKKFENEDLELYTRCFKCYIGFKRNQHRKIMALIAKDSLVDNKINNNLLDILRKKLSSEIITLCKDVICICEVVLNNLVNQPKISLFFTKTLADHYRYIYEINEDEEAKNKAKEIYEKALKLSQEGKCLPTEIIYLTFCLNYSVFLHDTLGNRDEAIKFAKGCLHAALKDTEEIVDNNQKDIILICQMIKDNLSLWKNEMPDELNML